MVCEGEKSADAAAVLFPNMATTASSGGANAAAKTDWSPLQGRRVLIWPDHDGPGQRYAASVTKLLKAVGAIEVHTLNPAALGMELPEGWDAANALAEGWTAERLQPMLNPPPLENPEPMATSQRKATLNVVAGDLPELVDEAERLLMEHELNLYQRSNKLVRAVVNQPETVHGISRPGGKTLITPVDTEYLLDRLNRHIRWQRWNPRKGAWAVCNASRLIAMTLLSRAGEWKFRPLVGVINAPTLRPDGSVIEKPGYDAKTGLLFVSQGVIFPALPEHPSREQGRAALDVLLTEVLSGFPFAEPHDRSAALSAILTGCTRPGLRTAPLHAFNAPRAATGKSLLANTVSLIVTGTGATAMTFSPEPEEMRKRILATLMQGDAVVSLDNIEGPLFSDALCTALTEETFTDRLLGVNCTQQPPAKAGGLKLRTESPDTGQ